MKLIEMKNKLAFDAAKLIFQNKIDVIFIGGTALNTFYLDYRFSEDLDLGYLKENKKHEIEELLRKNGYTVSRTDRKHRDIITLEGVSIKMDVIEYEKKYNGFEEKAIGEIKIKTLKIEEFTIEKIISFFTREDRSGMARDAYDIFAIEKKHGLVSDLVKKEKRLIRKNIISLDHNIDIFKSDTKKIESAVVPYLRKSVAVEAVLEFLKNLRSVLK